MTKSGVRTSSGESWESNRRRKSGASGMGGPPGRGTSGIEAVAVAAERGDPWCGGGECGELAAQPVHVLDDGRGLLPGGAPDPLQELVRGEDPAGGPGQQLQQGELLGAQRERDAVHGG